MVTWVLVFHLTWDSGWSWNKGTESYDSKEDCMEQLEGIRENAKANDLRIIALRCKPEKPSK